MPALPDHAVKGFARRVLGEQMLGMLDYFRRPEARAAWGGPFNGQRVRHRIFSAIVDQVRPHALIETGTYLGVTTAALAATGLPVYSIERQPRRYGFARARLFGKRNVHLRRGDSRSELVKLLDGSLQKLARHPLFFYLDAHWNEDLPLAEEIAIVFKRGPRSVLMIDDFQVPGDAGYGYDDYGPGRALDAAYLAPLVTAYDLAVFYPSVPSRDETGMRRGCVVLCRAPALCETLQSIPLLHRAEAG